MADYLTWRFASPGNQTAYLRHRRGNQSGHLRHFSSKVCLKTLVWFPGGVGHLGRRGKRALIWFANGEGEPEGSPERSLTCVEVLRADAQRPAQRLGNDHGDFFEFRRCAQLLPGYGDDAIPHFFQSRALHGVQVVLVRAEMELVAVVLDGNAAVWPAEIGHVIASLSEVLAASGDVDTIVDARLRQSAAAPARGEGEGKRQGGFPRRCRCRQYPGKGGAESFAAGDIRVHSGCLFEVLDGGKGRGSCRAAVL